MLAILAREHSHHPEAKFTTANQMTVTMRLYVGRLLGISYKALLTGLPGTMQLKLSLQLWEILPCLITT